MDVAARGWLERRRFIPFFIAGELLAVFAIPFMLIDAYHTFLTSDAGTYVEELTPQDPGWRSFFEYSTITPIIEQDSTGETTAIALHIQNPDHSAGRSGDAPNPAAPSLVASHIVIIPQDFGVGSDPLVSLPVTKLQGELSQALNQRVELPQIVGADATLSFASADGVPLNAEVNFSDENFAQQISELVAFPAAETSALRVRVITASRDVSVVPVAQEIASNGFEVTEIGNVNEWGTGKTALAVPSALLESAQSAQAATELATLLEVDIITDEIGANDEAVTLLLGSDFAGMG